MISPAAAELIRRCREQVLSGLGCVHREEFDMARVWFAAATSSLDALGALLDAPAPPLRRLVVVGPREEADELPEWATKRHGGNDGDAA